MSTYCAPCLADLALLREAVTTVSGTAACVAHAVLLLHPTDTPQQRLARLSELRSTAEGKIATASADDVPALELLVQEYALAGAMDMTVPLRDLAGDRTPRPPKSNRRNRGRDRDRERGPRPDRPEGTGAAASGDGPAGEAPSGDAPSGDAPSGDAPFGEAPAREAAAEPPAAVTEAPAAVTPAPEPAAEPAPASQPASEPTGQSASEVPAG